MLHSVEVFSALIKYIAQTWVRVFTWEQIFHLHRVKIDNEYADVI